MMSKKPPVIRTPPPVVIQQPPAVVVQSIEPVNSSTHAEASESQKIELNCREQSQSDAREIQSNPQEEEQPPGDVSQTEPTHSNSEPQIPSNTSEIHSSSPPSKTLPEEHDSPSVPCVQGTETTDKVEGGGNKPVCSTGEKKVLIRSVNPPPVNEPTGPVEVRPKIKIQANEVLLKERAKIKVKVALPHSNISKDSRQSFSNVTRIVMRSHSINSVLRSSAAGNTREGHNKSMDDIFGRREEARLKRRAERQAKLRAETMSKLPAPRQSASPNMQPMASAKTMMSSLEMRGFIAPEVSRSQVRVQDAQKTTLVLSPTNPAPSTGGETPQSETHSGFMKSDTHSKRMKPGSFMHYHKDVSSQESISKFDSVDALGELENEHIDLSDTSDAEPMDEIGQDSPDESDKMDADKSSFRESSPSLSSRTATASPSRSSSYTASRGSRSGSWTKSSSLSKRSSSLSRSRSHNSTSSSTTPTKRKSRRRRVNRSPSSPSIQSPSISRSPTPMPAQNPRYSIKRKKGKLSPDSPVPRKYKNTSTVDYDPDYAAFTEVPPEIRNTDAFCYFGNPSHKEREHTPQSYSNSRPHMDRYMQAPRPNNPRYLRNNYSQHSHTHGGHNIYYDHSSPRPHNTYRGNSSSQGSSSSRSRYNYSGGYNTSPHHNYSNYPPHKSNYNYNHNYNNYPPQRQPYGNNYSHQRGGYNNHQSQRGSYMPTHPRPGYNQYHQKDNYPSKRSSKYEGESAKPEKADNAGFGAFYRKDDEWAEEDRRNLRNESLSENRTVSARLAGRLGPPPSFHHKSESGYWKGPGGSYQERSFYKTATDSRSNSDEEYKLNLKIKDIIAKNEQILRRKIESEEDKMIHGVS